jgi:hypothetical protein
VLDIRSPRRNEGRSGVAELISNFGLHAYGTTGFMADQAWLRYQNRLWSSRRNDGLTCMVVPAGLEFAQSGMPWLVRVYRGRSWLIVDRRRAVSVERFRLRTCRWDCWVRWWRSMMRVGRWR